MIFRKPLWACVIVAAGIAMMAPVAQAATPNPGYEAWAGCPSKAENPSVSTCLRTDITGGHFQMGNKDVPITVPMTLSGGVNPELKGFVYNSKGGLSAAKQQVPGGVIGLTGLDWLVNFLNIEQLKLFAVTELAGTPDLSNPSAPILPIKVHLINSALGSNCYVGSNANPITLHLTTGTTSPPAPNKPITGKEPVGSFNPTLNTVTLSNGVYVDNSFAAPGANGCTLTLFGFIPISINGVVNLASGLPAAAGTNETTQNFSIQIANVEQVYP